MAEEEDAPDGLIDKQTMNNVRFVHRQVIQMFMSMGGIRFSSFAGTILAAYDLWASMIWAQKQEAKGKTAKDDVEAYSEWHNSVQTKAAFLHEVRDLLASVHGGVVHIEDIPKPS